MFLGLAGCSSSSPTAPAIPATPLNYGTCGPADIQGARNAHGSPSDSVQVPPAGRVQWWYGVTRAGGGNAGQSAPLVTFLGDNTPCIVFVSP